MQKGFAPILLILSIVLLLGVVGGVYYLLSKEALPHFGKLPLKPTDNNPRACTMEAKICPDGSSVGKSGLNCEFSLCPATTPTISLDEPIPEAVLLAEHDFVKISGLDRSQIVYDKLEKVEWSDSSLGCPKDGNVYAQVITPGYRVVFSYNQQQFEYHTDLGQNFVMCQPIEGKSCGGIAGEVGPMACPTGYDCKYPEPTYPDASGKCTKK